MSHGGAERLPTPRLHPNDVLIEVIKNRYNMDISGYGSGVILQRDIKGADVLSFVNPADIMCDLRPARSVSHIYFSDPWDDAIEAGLTPRISNKPRAADLILALKLMLREFESIPSRLYDWIYCAQKIKKDNNQGILETLNLGYYYRPPEDINQWLDFT